MLAVVLRLGSEDLEDGSGRDKIATLTNAPTDIMAKAAAGTDP